jgi:hypothetical protein
LSPTVLDLYSRLSLCTGKLVQSSPETRPGYPACLLRLFFLSLLVCLLHSEARPRRHYCSPEGSPDPPTLHRKIDCSSRPPPLLHSRPFCSRLAFLLSPSGRLLAACLWPRSVLPPFFVALCLFPRLCWWSCWFVILRLLSSPFAHTSLGPFWLFTQSVPRLFSGYSPSVLTFLDVFLSHSHTIVFNLALSDNNTPPHTFSPSTPLYTLYTSIFSSPTVLALPTSCLDLSTTSTTPTPRAECSSMHMQFVPPIHSVEAVSVLSHHLP